MVHIPRARNLAGRRSARSLGVVCIGSFRIADLSEYFICMQNVLSLESYFLVWGLPLITYAPRGRGGSNILYISFAYYMLKGREGVQIACTIAYVKD